jgi:hypothetical protein
VKETMMDEPKKTPITWPQSIAELVVLVTGLVTQNEIIDAHHAFRGSWTHGDVSRHLIERVARRLGMALGLPATIDTPRTVPNLLDVATARELAAVAAGAADGQPLGFVLRTLIDATDPAHVTTLRQRIADLESALREACDEYEDNLSYKMPYLVEKHGDRETLARWRVVVGGDAPASGIVDPKV